MMLQLKFFCLRTYRLLVLACRVQTRFISFLFSFSLGHSPGAGRRASWRGQYRMQSFTVNRKPEKQCTKASRANTDSSNINYGFGMQHLRRKTTCFDSVWMFASNAGQRRGNRSWFESRGSFWVVCNFDDSKSMMPRLIQLTWDVAKRTLLPASIKNLQELSFYSARKLGLWQTSYWSTGNDIVLNGKHQVHRRRLNASLSDSQQQTFEGPVKATVTLSNPIEHLPLALRLWRSKILYFILFHNYLSRAFLWKQLISSSCSGRLLAALAGFLATMLQPVPLLTQRRGRVEVVFPARRPRCLRRSPRI